MIRRIWQTLVLVAWLSMMAGTALGQTPTPNEINVIAKELWCPLCNGVRLDNCELQACIQMREVIAQKLMAGESKEQIKTYFVEQYGDVVLGAPANQGFNRVVWLFPVLAAVVGVGWLVFLVRSWSRRRPLAAGVSAPASSSTAQPVDEYMRRVDDELKRQP